MSGKKSILIVEDELLLLDTWKEMLLSLGYNPLLADNAMTAINILNEEKVDLIITDLRMPKYDGFFLLNFLKENNFKIPTMVCTGQDSNLSEFDITKLIYKPFDMVALIGEMDQYI